MRRFAALATLAAIIAFAAFPLIWMTVSSFKSAAELARIDGSFLPRDWTLRNYLDVWAVHPFHLYLWNSAVIALSTATLCSLLSALAGYGLAMARGPTVSLLLLLILTSMMIPEQAILVPVFLFSKEVGLINSRLGVILVLAATGLGTFLIRQHCLKLPRNLLDAARIDQASEARIFLTVVLPYMRPAILTVFLLSFLASWDAFLWPLVLIFSDELMPVQIGIAKLSWEYYTAKHFLLAISTVSVAPVVLLLVLFSRQIYGGIARLYQP